MIPNPTAAELKFAEVETQKHIDRVSEILCMDVCGNLQARAGAHDASKFSNEELPYFAVYTPKLAGVTYASPEYKQFLVELQPALTHHYEANSHHPEHYPNGWVDMSLFDLIEMVVDHKAASERHANGNIWRSLKSNIRRFHYSYELVRVLHHTITELFPNEPFPDNFDPFSDGEEYVIAIQETDLQLGMRAEKWPTLKAAVEAADRYKISARYVLGPFPIPCPASQVDWLEVISEVAKSAHMLGLNTGALR